MEGRAVSTAAYAGGLDVRGPTPPPTPSNPSCFGNIEDVVGTAESTAGRVERLVNRLIGEEPAEKLADGKIVNAGLLHIADEHARDIRRHLQRIFYAVERLEKQLP